MGSTRASRTRHSKRVWSDGALGALALANVRYWPTVAPAVYRELARWREPASSIADPRLRELALAKLAHERFNAKVAATLATLAPRAQRADTAKAIVALELLFDYLDGRTEQATQESIADSLQLYRPFIASVQGAQGGAGHTWPEPESPRGADWNYLAGLSERTRERLCSLPSAGAVAEVARASAQRCAQAQTRLHAAARMGDEQLQRWAEVHARGSGLEWREYTAGCASSVLAMHALIAAAAEESTSAKDAQRIDAAYLAIGAVITILDSVVDWAEDSACGRTGFIRLYDSRELAEQLCALTREALCRAREAPHRGHHVMTLAGVAAYYTTHPGASEPHARELARMVRRQLSPTIWPTLAVMRSWRAAKSARAMRTRRAQPNSAPGKEQT